MPDLDPIHYLAAGAIILLVLSLGYCQYLRIELRASEGALRAFVAESKAAAAVQIADNWRVSAKRDEITRNLELNHVQATNNLTAKYSARRLLNSNARSSPMPTVPATSESGASGQDETGIVRSMDAIEEELLGILEQGDKAINSLIIHEDWEDSQSVVK
jgi:hypothetical protein